MRITTCNKIQAGGNCKLIYKIKDGVSKLCDPKKLDRLKKSVFCSRARYPTGLLSFSLFFVFLYCCSSRFVLQENDKFLYSFKGPHLQQICFLNAEEAFKQFIVQTVSLAGHALNNSIFYKAFLYLCNVMDILPSLNSRTTHQMRVSDIIINLKS